MKTTPHAVYLKATKGEYIGHADIAKLIRSALARAFAGMTFSVKTKTYAGGGSVDVRWTDGPTTSQVDRVAQQFSTRAFDGSIDMAHDSDLWLYPDGSANTAHTRGTEGSRGSHPEVIESAKSPDAVLVENIAGAYIFCSRQIGPKAIQAAIEQVRAENWASLEQFDWATLTVEESTYGARVEGGESVRFGGARVWLNSEIQWRAQQLAYPETLPEVKEEVLEIEEGNKIVLDGGGFYVCRSEGNQWLWTKDILDALALSEPCAKKIAGKIAKEFPHLFVSISEAPKQPTPIPYTPVLCW